jgi:ATP-dependent protease HslVU (ClpYQ) peptidase subunit
MTTIAVVRKGGVAAIAADTLTKWGTGKESAAYVTNHEKILRVGESFIGITGSATFKMILHDYFSEQTDSRLGSASDIFRTWNRLHGVLKERYYLMPEEDKEDALESSRMDVLIVNPQGIFGVAAHRTVQEFSRFYAYGSGSDYALGALFSAYDDPRRDAEQLARHAIEAAVEFDDGTGAPITSHSVRLLRP